MYWLVTDETNVEPGQGRFFIYGGLIMTPEQMLKAHEAIQDIRMKYGFSDTDDFKFETRSRPQSMTVEKWTRAKGEAIAAAEKLGATLVIYVVLHDIARNKPKTQITEWALNSVVAHFDMRFLTEKMSYGMVCIDRVDEKFGYRYLSSKFQEGIELPDGRTAKLARIIHYSISCNGASHISSLVDIVLGGMRYSVNTAGGVGKEELAREILPPISRMMWHAVKPDGSWQVGGYGFLQYPKDVLVPEYREQYVNLARTLSEWGSS
jgi:hypothetical protein